MRHEPLPEDTGQIVCGCCQSFYGGGCLITSRLTNCPKGFCGHVMLPAYLRSRFWNSKAWSGHANQVHAAGWTNTVKTMTATLQDFSSAGCSPRADCSDNSDRNASSCDSHAAASCYMGTAHADWRYCPPSGSAPTLSVCHGLLQPSTVRFWHRDCFNPRPSRPLATKNACCILSSPLLEQNGNLLPFEQMLLTLIVIAWAAGGFVWICHL